MVLLIDPKIKVKPKVCNCCGGKVVYIKNDLIYGKPQGSGYCYYCTCCGAYVGTHKSHPTLAMGILADSDMRYLKMFCHNIFDKMWINQRTRTMAYEGLAKVMNIPEPYCHFGYFDKPTLVKAQKILINMSLKGESFLDGKM